MVQVLRKGDRGPAVLELTKQLVGIGLIDQPTKEFTEQIEWAIEAIQAQGIDWDGIPLKMDGIYGKRTDWAMNHPDQSAAFRPVMESIYDILPLLDYGKIGHVALRFAIFEMWRGAGERSFNNGGPDVAHYLRKPEDRLTTSSAWCAGFVSRNVQCAAMEMGCEMPFEYTVGARDVYNQAKRGTAKRARILEPGEDPETGDLIVWWREALTSWKGHVGHVHSLNNNVLTTVEGNRGGFPSKVNHYDYDLDSIDRLIGFVRLLDGYA